MPSYQVNYVLEKIILKYIENSEVYQQTLYSLLSSKLCIRKDYP